MQIRVSFLFLIAAVLSFQPGCSRGARDYLARGNKLFEAKKYEDAAIQYQRATQMDPNLGEAYYRMGLVKMEENRGIEAYAPLFRAVELMPGNDAAKATLADVTLSLYVAHPQHPKGLYDQVTNLSDRLLANDRNSFDGLRLKGLLRLMDRNPKEAIVFFEKANKVKPMRPDLVEGWVQALFEDKQPAEGERLALQVIEKTKEFGSIYDVLYRQYVSTGRPADAEKILKTKVANNPREANYLLQLAQHYASTQNSAEMNSALQRVLTNPKDFPEARLQVGNFYAGLRQWDQALQQFEEGARSNAKEKLTYQKRVTDALLAQGKKAEAAKTVELIIEEHPKDEDARRIRATLLLDTGGLENAAQARGELQDLAKNKPNDARLRSLLGRAYLAESNLDAARSEYQEAVRARKDDLPSLLALAAISLNQGKPTEALKYAGDILSIDPENGPAKLVRVTAMIGAGYYGEARTELTRLSHQYPKSWDVQFEFGLLAIAQKKFSEAEAIFRKLYQTGQADSRPAAALVETYAAENQLDRALQLLNEDLKKSPGSLPVHRLLALTAARARKYDLAIAEYQQLLVKDPKSVQLRMQLGEVHHLKGDLNSAIAVIEQAPPLAPKDPKPLMLLASMLSNAGRNGEAIAAYQKVLALRPDNPFVLNSIAFLLAETGGNLDEAMRMVQRALEKAPGHPVLTDTLGWVYLKKGMKDSAVRTFSSLVRQQPKDPTYRYHLAMALLETGDKQRAKTELGSALASEPAPEMEQKIRALVTKIG